MEKQGWAPSRVIAALQEARTKDLSFKQGQVLGSMCTEPHELAALAYQQFLPTNLGDPDHFPGTAHLEVEVLQDIAEMVGARDADQARFLTGGTEANLQACYMAREITGKSNVVVSDAAHFSFEKATRMLGIKLVRTPCGPDQRSDPAAMAAAIDADTALVVAIAGSTELGLVDDIPAIARLGPLCHVDAAFGGYVLPFMDGKPWNFAVPGVTSIGLDPHKMGMAPIPAGALVVKDAAHWQATAVETSYVSTDRQSTLMGTRPGAAVAATWAVHRAVGRDGYQQNTVQCMENTQRLATGLTQHGAQLVATPELNVITFRYGDVAATHKALAGAGFRLNIVPRFDALRIVVGPHVSAATVDHFVQAFKELP